MTLTFTVPASTSTVTPVSTQTYAQVWNSRYSNTNAVLKTLKQRLDEQIQNLPPMSQKGARATIVQATKTWSKNFPKIKIIDDLPLVEARLIPMSSILIDITIQRLLDLDWVCKIIRNFSPYKIQPIHVYRVEAGGDLESEYPVGTQLYGCWDSQHTAVALYIIATMCLGQSVDDIELPANIYPVKSKKDIREIFVSLNSADGKVLLSAIDIFMQMVMGVRIDGNKNPVWEEAALKQQYLEEADLFVTSDKFSNTHLPGAISRMQEINGYTSDIIRKFCMYTTTIKTPRPIASQEIEIMCDFFESAKQHGIDYTDAQIVDLGNHLHDLFDADFHESSEFWAQVKTAYLNWHAKAYRNVPKNLRPSTARMAKNKTYGGTFLIYQLNKTWNHPVPGLRNNTTFQPDTKDLY
jgi:hypothetical protein